MCDLAVRVKQGKLLGTIKEGVNGTVYRAFLGVPYAAPPLGSLRFKVIGTPSKTGVYLFARRRLIRTHFVIASTRIPCHLHPGRVSESLWNSRRVTNAHRSIHVATEISLAARTAFILTSTYRTNGGQRRHTNRLWSGFTVEIFGRAAETIMTCGPNIL